MVTTNSLYVLVASFIFFKEKINVIQFGGLILVILATILVAVFNPEVKQEKLKDLPYSLNY